MDQHADQQPDQPADQHTEHAQAQRSESDAKQPLRYAALMPNHRDLYVLAAGLLLGLLLGPSVLGRASPETYSRYFADYQIAAQHLAIHDANVQEILKKLVAADVTSVAMDELVQTRAAQREPLQAAVDRARQSQGRLLAAMLAVLVFMIFETLPEATAILVRSRLATARYALMALTLALLLAQPQQLKGMSMLFLALLLAVGLAVALVPLSKKSDDAQAV